MHAQVSLPASVPNFGPTCGLDIHMSKGDHDDSYSKNSEVQNRLINDAVIPNLDGALGHLQLPAYDRAGDRAVILADLGSSSGPNAILLMSQFVEKIKERVASNDKSLPPFQAYFNDLPSNDFNNLFQLLSSKGVKRSSFFSAAVSGSFYDPLFPESTVNVFNSTFGLHWLSKIPASVVDRESPAFNKGKWFAVGSCGSNKEAVNAFKDQNAEDIDTFLKLRAKELVPGGLLCFAICIRWDSESGKVETSSETNFKCLENAVKKLVKEGIVSEDLLDSFNIPLYLQTKRELEELIRKHHSTFEVLTCKEMGVRCFADVKTAHNRNSPQQIIESAISVYKGALSDTMRGLIGERAAKLLLKYLRREVTANVVGLSQETAVAFVALKKKRPARDYQITTC